MATNDSEQEVDSSINQENEPKICKICDAKATRRYYGVMSCAACSDFFRRTVKSDLQYECFKNKSCDITKKTRKQCKYCRFQNCLDVGMSATGIFERRARKNLLEKYRNELQAEKKVEPVPDYYAIDFEFLADVKTASELAFGSNKSPKFELLLESNLDVIRISFEPSIERARDFLSNISLLKQMPPEDFSQFTGSRLLPVVYMRSILLFPGHTKLIQIDESDISQFGLTQLTSTFKTFSNQLQQMNLTAKEFILLPLYCAIKDNEGDGNVIQSPIVKNIRERVRSLLCYRWFLPEQQVLLNSILQLSSKHEENLSKLNADVPNFHLLHKIFISMFDISKK